MNKYEAGDMKAYLIEQCIKNNTRMNDGGARIIPTKLNSDFTVVCNRVNVTINVDSGVETESIGDTIILKVQELSFYPTDKIFTDK